jgi:hypothetical protein
MSKLVIANRHSICVSILFMCLLWAAWVYGQARGDSKPKLRPEVLAALPKLCWGQYLDNVPNTAEYHIRLTCGVYSNHYCPGLVHMIDAQEERKTRQRFEHLRSAKMDMEYTLQGTENIPECSIRTPARMNLERIKLEMETIRLSMPKR